MCLATAVHSQDIQIATNGDVEISFQVFGDQTDPPLVFIDGLATAVRPGGDALTEALVAQGFRVVRFDNRDAGQSTVLTDAGAPPSNEVIVESLMTGTTPPVAYTLSDMAGDTMAVLDAAGIEQAHVMGASLGGMIAQTIATEYPGRTLSLISVSSSTGDPDLPFGPAMEAMTAPPAATAEGRVEQYTQLYRAFEGDAFKMTDAEILARVEADGAAGDPLAPARQGAAATASGDRQDRLASVELPALVIHGSDDPLFPDSHADSTAEAVPNGQLEIVDGLGHIVSDAAAGEIASRVATFVNDLSTSNKE
ncbi:alpha/beta hydrolase [Roseovarius sp. Pro17]|uniref:alpha/beta fold hydrolase n=1 Tax=Roseovarius sp. Pro17 TaxID=3108175 RepID=UPI002D7A03FE|nr:alpha/beta hydrolase [Roseovarius sp. Pro17]